jgi:pimeloyl-ACP methyl ester carboxylesterase
LAKFARRSAAVLLVLGLILLLLPAERTPVTGQWLVRAGLEPRTIRVGRFDVRYVRKGQGPAVVLIHGLASSIYTWAGVIEPLSQRFDVIALDLPGFGASSQPDDLVFDDGLRTVGGLMDTLGVAKAHLVGNSMGGALSLLMAAREPARVDRVVVLDSAGFNMRSADRPFMVRVMASRSAALFSEALPVRRLLTGATLRHLFHDRTLVTDERINEYTAPLLRPGALASMRSLLLSRLIERFDADLAAISARTLVVWGSFDPWLPLSHADRFVSAIKGARKVVLEAGHMPQEERPADVARLILDFLIS